MRVEVIRDPAHLAGLRAEWTALLRASPADGLFLTWEWLTAWWAHLSAGARLHLVTVRSGGELTAVAPFLLRRRAPEAPFPVLEFLGTGSAGSDYLDLIVRDSSAAGSLDALAGYLRGARLPLRLGQLRAGSAAAALAARLGGEGWRATVEEAGVCPVAVWPQPSWDAYMSTLTRKHRTDFRRCLANLHRQFDVRFEQAVTEGETQEALDILVSLHDARWRDRGGSTAFHTGSLRSFHGEFSRTAQHEGWLRLFVLRLDGRPVSALYGFRYGNAFYDYQKGFDPGYARHAVGLVTIGLAIRAAIEEGAGEFDFLHGDEPYKFRWARAARPLSRFELVAPGARGAVYRWLVAGGRGARRTARRVLGDALAERLAGQRG